MPIVYVTDMERSLAFYESLGFAATTRGSHWSELAAGDGAVLALHLAGGEHAAKVELALVADGLEDVASRHRDALARGIADEAFGRSLVLRDPDGLAIQVNEHDPELVG